MLHFPGKQMGHRNPIGHLIDVKLVLDHGVEEGMDSDPQNDQEIFGLQKLVNFTLRFLRNFLPKT